MYIFSIASIENNYFSDFRGDFIHVTGFSKYIYAM